MLLLSARTKGLLEHEPSRMRGSGGVTAEPASILNRAQAADRLAAMVAGGAVPPFVYCYPVRSAYRPLPQTATVAQIWADDFEHSPTRDLNLYLHVPFCRYKCGFCNLYTVISEDVDIYDQYVDALCGQIRAHAEIIQARRLRTIYIGGGTPSLLKQKHFDRLFATFDEVYPAWRSTAEEVAIEASPDSIVRDPATMEHLLDLGLTRANVGIQSLQPRELREAGRGQASDSVVRSAIEHLKASRLPNLSTDLIMGFQGQTDETWMASVDELLAMEPETVSTYFLTVRPDAWFSKTGDYAYMRDRRLYGRYQFARERMKAAGMVQESNVRYKRMGLGGYRQKVLQFSGVPVLGLGAGARTYTNTVDYIDGGSADPNMQQVHAYMNQPLVPSAYPEAGFVYDDDERIRKRLALDLFDLDLAELDRYGFSELRHRYEPVLEAAQDQGLLARVGATRVRLTELGFQYRDILSWMLFSPSVVARDRDFYRDLHERNGRASSRGAASFVSGLAVAARS